MAFRWLRLLLLGAGLMPQRLLATSFPGPSTVRHRAELANRVVLAQVVQQRVETGDTVPPRLRTWTTLRVRESLKGSGPDTLEVAQLGGAHDGWTSGVVGDAHFEPGETVLLFLRCDEVAKTPCGLVGLGLGKVSVHTSDGRWWASVPRPDGAPEDVRPLEQVVDEVRGMGERASFVLRSVAPVPVGRAVERRAP